MRNAAKNPAEFDTMFHGRTGSKFIPNERVMPISRRFLQWGYVTTSLLMFSLCTSIGVYTLMVLSRSKESDAVFQLWWSYFHFPVVLVFVCFGASVFTFQAMTQAVVTMIYPEYPCVASDGCTHSIGSNTYTCGPKTLKPDGAYGMCPYNFVDNKFNSGYGLGAYKWSLMAKYYSDWSTSIFLIFMVFLHLRVLHIRKTQEMSIVVGSRVLAKCPSNFRRTLFYIDDAAQLWPGFSLILSALRFDDR